MTICDNDYNYYLVHGRLNPNPRANYPMQDHCQSCETKDGKLLRHPDLTIIITICKREWDSVRRNGRLKP